MGEFTAHVRAVLDATGLQTQLNTINNLTVNVRPDANSLAREVQTILNTGNFVLNISRVNVSNVLNQVGQAGTQAGNAFSRNFNNSLTRMNFQHNRVGIVNLQRQLDALDLDHNAVSRITQDFNDMNIAINRVRTRLNENGTNIHIQVSGIDELGRAVEIVRDFDMITNETTGHSAVTTRFDGVAAAGKDIIKLDNDINDWLNKNTRAAERYQAAFDGIRQAISQVQSQADLDDIRSDFNFYKELSRSNGLTTNSQEMRNATTAYRELLNIQKEINSLQVSQQKTDPNANPEKYAEITRQLQNYRNEYAAINEQFNGLFTQNQLDGLNSAVRQGEEELQRLKAGVLDIQNMPAKDLDIITLDNDISEWLKKNARAAADFGQELENIQTQLRSGNLTQGQFDSLDKQFKMAQEAARSQGKVGKTFSQRMAEQFASFTTYISAASVVWEVVDITKQMVKNVYDIDTAMTSLKKVTNETDDAYKSFLSGSAKTATELGRSISSVVEQTATWAKLGYDLQDASQLSKISAVYSNVAEVDDATAVSDIVTAMKAFNIEAKNAMTIVDPMNELGNKFATSAADLGTGLSNAASAMNLAGTDLNKTLAMLTGGAEITQNAGEFGNFLKVGSMRIRGLKGQLEELGEEVDSNIESISKVQTQILNLTHGKVNIFDNNGDFRDYYDIMLDISKVYDDLASTEQANLMEILFGKMRGNQGAALIQAFQSGQIQKAYETAMNAQGSAMAEQEAWMDSIQAKVQQFQAAWQGLSQAIIGSDFIKGLVDGATVLLNLLTQIVETVGALPTLVAGFTLGGSLFSGGTVVANNFVEIARDAKNAKGAIDILAGSFKGAGKASLSFITSFGKIGLVIAAVAAAAKVLDWAIETPKEAAEKMEQSFENVRKTQEEMAAVDSELETVENRITELKAKGGLTLVEKGELEKLKDTSHELKLQQDILAHQEKQQYEQAARDAVNAFNKNFKKNSNYPFSEYARTNGFGEEVVSKYAQWEASGNVFSGITDSIVAYDGLIKQLNDIDNGGSGNRDNVVTEINKKEQALWDYVSTLSTYKENIESLPDVEKNKYASTLGEINSAIKIVYDTLDPNAWKQIQFDNLLNVGSTQKTIDSLVELAAANRYVGITAKDVSPALAAMFEASGFTVNDIVDYVNSVANVFDVATAKAELANKIKWDVSDTFDDGYRIQKWLNELSNEDLEVAYSLTLNPDSANWTLEEWKENLKNEKVEISLGISGSSQQLIDGIGGIREYVSKLGENGTVAYSDLTGVLSGYADAVEYVGGAYRVNTTKLNKMLKAQAKEQIAANKIEKSKLQDTYLENAKSIEKYRDAIEKAGKGNQNLVDGNNRLINSLLAKNKEIAETCNQYDMMNVALENSVDAYNNWLAAKEGADFGDYAAGFGEAFKKVRDTNRTGYGYGFEFDASAIMVLPEEIDTKDRTAVNKYLTSIGKYISSEGKLNLATFVGDAVTKGLINRDGDEYNFAPGITTKQLETDMNMTQSMIRAFLDELSASGWDISFADETKKTFGDYAVAGIEAAEKIRQSTSGIFDDIDITVDVTDINSVEGKVAKLKDTISKMNAKKAELKVDSSEYGYANDVINYCAAQIVQLQRSDNVKLLMSIDTSQIGGELGKAFDLLQEFVDTKEEIQVGANTEEVNRKLEEIRLKLAGNPAVIDGTIGNIDTTSITSLEGSIETLDILAVVDESAIIGYDPPDEEVTVTYKPNLSALPTSLPTITRYVNYVAIGDVDGASTSTTTTTTKTRGYTMYSGNAYAGGIWGAKSGGQTLVGEIDREIMVDPKTGRWQTIGDNGAEFVNVPKGAIIFNHKQTESLLKYGRINTRGRALASGNAMVTGGGRLPSIYSNIGNGGSGTSSGANGDSDNKEDKVDWIEIAIKRFQSAVERLKVTAESTFTKLSTRLEATNSLITQTNNEISLQQKAYNRYLQEANSVGLDSNIAARVRDGTIDINSYDEDTRNKISEYTQWYEKALECSDAIDELRNSLGELYKSKFDNFQADFENKLALMDADAEKYSMQMDKLSAMGYMDSAQLINSQINAQSARRKELENEANTLRRSLNEAVTSGEVEEGSEAWYEMQQVIAEVNNEILQTEVDIAELNESLRDLEWETFDYALEKISAVNDEAKFLQELLSNKDLFDDNGQMTAEGLASVGLMAQNYDMYLAQSSMYADEISKLDKEIAKDPANKALIDRRAELLKLQQDSISAALDEKNAIVDLVQNGINAQLDAMKELSDSYIESLESAKDLYEYQKNIEEKTQKIADIEKQIAAYQNNTSGETRAKLQKLQVSLESAKDELRETEYDRFVSDSRSMMDDIYSQYESILNQRLDNVDALIGEVRDSINNSSTDIINTIVENAGEFGYKPSDDLISVWTSNLPVLSDENNGITAISRTASGIYEAVLAIANHQGVNVGKSYSSGGFIDYTGLASVHGSKSNPELALNADDTKWFIELRDVLREMSGVPLTLLNSGHNHEMVSHFSGNRIKDIIHSTNGAVSGGVTNYYGGVTVEIDHVEDYNDLVNKMRNDPKFEGMVQSMTIDKALGKNPLGKNRFSW